MSPPRQPLQGLIENDGGEVATKTLPVHRLSRFGLIRLEVRGPNGVPLLRGPLAGAEAHQIEAARTQRRRFPVDHGNLLARVSCSEHDVLSEELAMDHRPRPGAQPVDAVGVAVESPADEPTLSGFEIRQNLANALGALAVLRVVVAGKKAGLGLRQVAGRCVKARCPSRRHRPAVHVGEAPEQPPATVFEKDPVKTAIVPA